MLFEQTPEALQVLGPSGKPIGVSLPEHFSVGPHQPGRRPTLDSIILMVAVSPVPQHGMLELPFRKCSIRFVERGEVSPGHFDYGKARLAIFFFPPDQVVSG